MCEILDIGAPVGYNTIVIRGNGNNYFISLAKLIFMVASKPLDMVVSLPRIMMRTDFVR